MKKMRLAKVIEVMQSGSEMDRKFAQSINEAHKIAFNPGIVPPEILNGAADYARELISHRIFPLPYDLCLFEFGPTGLMDWTKVAGNNEAEQWLWVLAYRAADDHNKPDWNVYFRAVIWMRCAMPTPWVIPGVARIFDDGSGAKIQNGVDAESFDVMRTMRNLCRDNDSITSKVFGAIGGASAENKKILSELCQEGDEGYSEFITKQMDIALENLLSVIGLISTSAGVTTELVAPKKKFINANRIKKGKPALEYEHMVVRIDPSLMRMPGHIAHGGLHASPRMHWRRGHIRTLSDGRKVQVRPCIVGDVTKGTIVHDYVVSLRHGADTLVSQA